MPELAACLALVRPVGMNDNLAAEWLAVAAQELAGYELARLRNGFNAARRTCSHHGQIIPCVMENMKYPWDMGKSPPRQLPCHQADTPIPTEIRGLIDNATKALTR